MPGTLSNLLWGPLFAHGYDRLGKAAEDAGLRHKRRKLPSRAMGRTDYVRHQLERGLTRGGRRGELIDASAERLPLADDSVNTVVATLVFCTIPQPSAALDEVARVLKPGGRFLFLEHVRANDPGTARWQDRLERPWGWFGRGCHPNRDTLATIEASPLEIAEVHRDLTAKAPPIVKPLIIGKATRADRV